MTTSASAHDTYLKNICLRPVRDFVQVWYPKDFEMSFAVSNVSSCEIGLIDRSFSIGLCSNVDRT